MKVEFPAGDSRNTVTQHGPVAVGDPLTINGVPVSTLLSLNATARLTPKCRGCGKPTPLADKYGRPMCGHCQTPKPIKPAVRTPRNQPCPCGSGKKAKACHCKRITQ